MQIIPKQRCGVRLLHWAWGWTHHKNEVRNELRENKNQFVGQFFQESVLYQEYYCSFLFTEDFVQSLLLEEHLHF